MSKTRQPAISYRHSIWLFSFLLLLLFAVFSIGTVVNILEFGNEWYQSEYNHFITTSESILKLLTETDTGQKILSGKWSNSAFHGVENLFQPLSLNINDRVKLIFKDKMIEVFPVVLEPGNGDPPESIPGAWADGWLGVRHISVVYKIDDETSVMASVYPENYTEAGPGVLVVLERKMDVFDSINIRIRMFIIFSILGLIFAYIVVLYYGRKMIQPFSRLENILENAERVDSGALEGTEYYRDPVQRAIETFDLAITKLHQQEKRLEALSKTLETPVSPVEDYKDDLLSSVKTGIMSFDHNQVLRSFTSQIPRLLNINRTQSIGKPCAEVFGCESPIYRYVTGSLQTGRGVMGRAWKWEVPGKPFMWLSISTSLIREQNGAISGVGCVVRDITVLKRLKQQIREKEHLAALGELSAGIAHEFRNPLGAIQGNAQYLVKVVEDSELREIADDIKTEVENLERIIRDFLKFAHPFQPEVSSVDLKRIVQEELENVVNNSDIDIRVEPSDRPAMIDIDENLIRQAFQNAISNACQAMEWRGKLTVEIIKNETSDSKLKGDNGFNWIIRIIDSGPGIKIEEMDELFKPFVSNREGGTGLGLAIVKKIVLIHNGFVEFEANQDRGAVLRITLPSTFDPDQTLKIRKVELN